MREASSEGSMAITLRQLESLIWIAEAGAAILIMQGSLQDVGIDTSTMKVDVDVIMTGRPKSLCGAL